jgi:hypothetical protein
MTSRLLDGDGTLNRADRIDDSVLPTVLRQRRAALTATWSYVSFAMAGVSECPRDVAGDEGFVTQPAS